MELVLSDIHLHLGRQKLLGPNRPAIEIPGDTVDPKAKRLDYIFASSGFNPSNPGDGGWIIKTAKVGFLSRHPDLQCSLSDHFSVEATLSHSRFLDETDSAKADHSSINNGVFLQSPANSEFRGYHTQLKNSSTTSLLPITTYDEILAMVHKYRLREQRQRRLRLGHFVGSLVVSIGCLIAVWWSPRNFVSFILMLLSTLGLSAGVIDGLIGGLFVGSEIRALKEFEWEISNARAAASGEPHVMSSEAVKDW